MHNIGLERAIQIDMEAKVPIKDPQKRLFYLRRAEKRAKNPEFKELWKRKIIEFKRIYNS